MAGARVPGTRVPEAYEEEVDRSARPPAAKQAQKKLLGALFAALGGGLLATLRGSLLGGLALGADLRDLFLERLRLLDLGRRGDGRDDRLLGVVEKLDSGRAP